MSLPVERADPGALKISVRESSRCALGVALALSLFPAAAFAAADTRLADAVEKSDRAAILLLLDRKTDVNAAQVDGMTALLWAAYQDNLDVAKRLVAAGADVTAGNRYGVTALSLACTNGDAAMVELLLGAGADANKPLRGGELPLLTAARTGRTAAVKVLLDHGAKVDATDDKGQTALMWAADDGNLDVVKQLIAAGANFRAHLDSGFSPFFFAIREGRIPVVQALLKAGIDVNEPMQSKRTGARGIKANMTPMHLAVENAHFELATMMLEAGADPNDQRSGMAPLHLLASVRKSSTGDDPASNPVAGSGNISSLQFVRQLVAHGADVNAPLQGGAGGPGHLSRKGSTPFLLAAQTADVPYMKLLVELGADPLRTNVDHSTPLMAAAGVGTRAPGEEAATEDEALAAVQLAIDLGGDINAVDDNGETAMHGAAYANFPRMVHFLASKGAKISIWNTKDKLGWTPQLVAEGHRPGNFKPSYDTLDAIKEEEIKNGVTPPPFTPEILVKGYGN
ncbi:MAG TPA: ankyrin repeat domain-containing protein [Opitutaceae bacterium]|nr:ankyrin repeat domain-containing protein [Opitutaceae bacterium]